MNLVCDASMLLSWILPTQQDEKAQIIFQEIEKGGSLYVPSLWFLEVANALLVAQRRKKISVKEKREALELILKLPLVIDSENYKYSICKIESFANKYNLSVYDATYLELAFRLEIPLATLDQPLFNAAKKLKVAYLYLQ